MTISADVDEFTVFANGSHWHVSGCSNAFDFDEVIKNIIKDLEGVLLGELIGYSYFIKSGKFIGGVCEAGLIENLKNKPPRSLFFRKADELQIEKWNTEMERFLL